MRQLAAHSPPTDLAAANSTSQPQICNRSPLIAQQDHARALLASCPATPPSVPQDLASQMVVSRNRKPLPCSTDSTAAAGQLPGGSRGPGILTTWRRRWWCPATGCRCPAGTRSSCPVPRSPPPSRLLHSSHTTGVRALGLLLQWGPPHMSCDLPDAERLPRCASVSRAALARRAAPSNHAAGWQMQHEQVVMRSSRCRRRHFTYQTGAVLGGGAAVVGDTRRLRL
jgi:hypothetical protein